MQPEWQACPYCGTAAPRLVPAAVAGPPGGPPPLDPARRFRVLVVDDDAESRYLLTHLLDRSGLPIDVETVSDGAEALRRAAREPFDLVLLDVMMPTMDGFAVCERLRAGIRTAFIPILMLTALEDSDSRTRGFGVGTDDFVSKPFQRVELLARVRRILHRTYGLRSDAAPLVADPLAAEQPSL
jgi:DNA-binding response OmpR family regulator